MIRPYDEEINILKFKLKFVLLYFFLLFFAVKTAVRACGNVVPTSEEMTFYLSSLVSLDDILFPSYIESYPSKKKKKKSK